MTDSNDQVEDLFNKDDESQQSNEPTGDEGKQAESKPSADQETLYTLPDGRELTGEQVNDEYRKLQTDYTAKAQKLAEYEKVQTGQPAQANADLEAIRKDPAYNNLKNVLVDDLAKEGYVKQEVLDQQFPLRYKQEKEVDSLLGDVDKLETTINEQGLPKVGRTQLLSFMAENDYRNPERAYEVMTDSTLTEEAPKPASKPAYSEKSVKTGLDLPKSGPLSFDDGSVDQAVKQVFATKDKTVE